MLICFSVQAKEWKNKNKWKILEDKITIKDGNLSFDEMEKSKVISDKYRKNIEFLNTGKEFIIKGNLDLDTSKSYNIEIIGLTKLNQNGYYKGEGLYGYDSSKDRNENIKVTLTPIK